MGKGRGMEGGRRGRGVVRVVGGGGNGGGEGGGVEGERGHWTPNEGDGKRGLAGDVWVYRITLTGLAQVMPFPRGLK